MPCKAYETARPKWTWQTWWTRRTKQKFLTGRPNRLWLGLSLLGPLGLCRSASSRYPFAFRYRCRIKNLMDWLTFPLKCNFISFSQFCRYTGTKIQALSKARATKFKEILKFLLIGDRRAEYQDSTRLQIADILWWKVPSTSCRQISNKHKGFT